MTQDTEDVVARLSRKQDGYPQTGRGTIDATGRGTVEMDPAPQVYINPDGHAAVKLIQSLSDRIDVLEGLISERSIAGIADDIASAFGDCFRSDVVSLRHAAMVRLGERLRKPLASDIARAALHQEGIAPK